ncbi:MAG: hypothetical protein AAFO94_22610, partial [Bacteroidota bacterium]
VSILLLFGLTGFALYYDGNVNKEYHIESVKKDMNLDIPNFDANKRMVMDKATAITKNRKSTQHADLTKEAFQAVAKMMSYLHMADEKIMDGDEGLSKIAARLDADQMMTKQADTIYAFFEAANEQLQQLK